VSGTANISGLSAFDNSGILSMTTASTSLTVSGELAFQSGALYIVQVSPTTASVVNVTGAASLAGNVLATFSAGSDLMKQYDILHSGALNGTTFAALDTANLPGGFTASLNYSATDAYLNLSASLGSGTGLPTNQQNVATALNTFFNNGGTLPANFVSVFGLTGSGLSAALTQLDGEMAADARLGAFQMMTEFLNLMLDPLVDGRLGSIGFGGSGRKMDFAPDQQPSPDGTLAYGNVFKAPPADPFAQRWTAWGASYGGSNTMTGNPTVGSSNVTTQTLGFAGGMDYHYSPDTIFGFALSGGGTSWWLSNGLGAGRSDAFQIGIYGVSRSGPAYLSAALATANHWFTTSRGALGDQLTANFNGQSYGGRIESGYHFSMPLFGVAPYAALQAQGFHTPSYSETDLTGGGFGLSYSTVNATDTRTELGVRFDDLMLVGSTPFMLRVRMGWAHDFVSNATLGAAFQSLTGAGFVVNGAPMPQDYLLTSTGAELVLSPRFALLAKFDGEFASGSMTYAGSGTLRYSW
jgi:uncharacterized protein with beta-barrel porin domain